MFNDMFFIRLKKESDMKYNTDGRAFHAPRH